jgi:hypothetical protein
MQQERGRRPENPRNLAKKTTFGKTLKKSKKGLAFLNVMRYNNPCVVTAMCSTGH